MWGFFEVSEGPTDHPRKPFYIKIYIKLYNFTEKLSGFS
jgi:hypothetical protein